MAEVLIGLLKQAIPENDSRKLYVVCQANESLTELSILARDGSLDNKQSPLSGIPIDNSITFATIQNDDEKVIYRNVERSHEWRTPGAVCEMACAIEGPQVPRKALVVKSDCYDLSLKENGSALRWLAKWAGQLQSEKSDE